MPTEVLKSKYCMGANLLKIVIGMLIIATLSGCAGDRLDRFANVTGKSESTNVTELNVLAAASLKDSLLRLAAGFEERENVKIIFSFASSGDLQTQIEQGAPADVFISAGKKQMDALEHRKLIDVDSRLNILSNDLVIVAPETSRVTLNEVEDLMSAEDIERVAIGTPETTPAGYYSKEALSAANAWVSIQPKLVMAKDVHQILSYVETGNVDAGFVYRSDAKLAKRVKRLLTVPDTYHGPIVYPIAVLREAHNPNLGARYAHYLTEVESSKVFKSSGFQPIRN